MKLEDVFDYLPSRPKPAKEKLLLDAVHEKSEWLPFLKHMSDSGLITPALQNAFHTKWVESGHFIRAQIRDDKALTYLLSLFLPKYSGEGLTVFRGENEHRFNSGQIGFCWTANRLTAEIFGRGLNACRGQGLLLTAYAPANAIFSGPNQHSKNLEENEVTVNPHKLIDIQKITTYPRSH